MKKAENPTDKDADLVLQDLDDKEKELNKLLLSGMENFQPNLNPQNALRPRSIRVM